MNPIVSIIIPVYNNLQLLKIMIQSILDQDYSNWELLLIDDGSDLEVINELQNYVNKDCRIRFVERNRDPKGAPTCRNIGFDLSNGEYIVFFDSDDYVASYCLSQRVAFMESHKNLDFAVFPAETFEINIGDGKQYFGVAPMAKRDDLRLFIIPDLPFVVWNNIYKRDSLKKYHIYWDEKLKSLQDSDYNIECLLANLNYQYVNVDVNIKPDYYYRVSTNNSISKNIVSISHLDSHLYFYKKLIFSIKRKYHNKYDEVLRDRAIFYFKIMLKANDKIECYFESLYHIVSSFPRGRFLIFRMKLYRFLHKRVDLGKKGLIYSLISKILLY